MSGEAIPISDGEFAQVRELAMRVAGISIAASKKALIVGRWSKRLHHHRLTNFKDYLTLLSGSNAGDEPQIALDLLTTNETNFFREPKHFDFIRDQVLPAVKPGNRFRVWSAACSSGEEPYSVALLLADRLSNGPWDVLGTDISSRVLEGASRPVRAYPLESYSAPISAALLSQRQRSAHGAVSHRSRGA